MPALASGGDRSCLIVWGDGRDAETQGMDIYGGMVRPDMLSGRVYKGEVGDESTPLGGVTVELYCSNDADDIETLITSTTTDSDGWYGLLVSGVCEFYNILETDPTGYTSVGATSVDGTVVTDNWIQYEYPLDGKTLTGNKFWDRPVSTTVECYSCADCSAKLNGNYPVVILQNNITGASRCIKFNSNNTTFDGQGFTIEWEGVNPELSYGIQMAGRTGNTIQNCRITDFETGISLRSSDDNNLINNTLFSNLGAGIWLCDSDNNNLINATLFSNGYGIRLLNSHHNNILGNNITQNQNGVGLSSSNFNSFVNNTICKQKEQDIYAFDATSSNTRSGNKCDKIYNWNSDNAYTCCDQVCTADQATTCSSGSELKDALKGDFNYVKFANNLYVPGGIAIDASHVTLDCNGYTISGNGESAGFLLDNLINVTIKDCTIRGFETGIAMPSSSLNNIHNNHIQNNGRGISLFKTSQVKPQGNSIFSNDLRYNRIYGISLSDAEKNYIHTNTVLDSSLYSIWVSGTCDNNITNNYGGDLNNLNPILYWHDKAVGGSVPAGTYSEIIFCNVSHSTIENVDIDNGNTKNDGILLINSKTTHIKNNLINSTNGVSSINSDDISIYDNDVTFSKSDGISMDHSEDSRIYNNTIENNTMSGILVSAVSNNADIFNNTIKKNYRGIEIRYSDDVKISENTIHQNTEEGISIKDSIRTDIFKNDILGNKFGLFFDHHTTQSNARENYICYNSVSDIFDEKLPRFLNTGDDNTCSSYFWKDGSVSDGCLHECVGWYNMKWGYSFHNPHKEDDLSYRRYAQTFGKDEVYYTIKICIHPPLCIPFVGCYCAKYILKITTPIPKLFPGIYYLAAYKNLAEGGECYGMSATSLRFYYGRDYPFNYNCSAIRVKDLAVNDEYGSHSLRVRREIHHGSQMSAENLNYYLWNLGEGNEANYVLNKARGGLKNKNQNMVSIKNGLLKGHVMNYDSVEDFDDGTSKIYVYDNNKQKFVNDPPTDKNEYPAIIIDRNTNSWSYKRNSEVWGSNMIFDIPYSIANRKDWSLPTSLSGLLKIVFGDATGNIEDMDGNLLGYDEFNNAYEDIPVGLGVPVFAGDEQPAILAVQPGNYNFTIFGSDGEYSDLIAGLNGAYVLENISSNNNTRDSLEFRMINGNPYYNELSFQTNDVQKPFNVTMFKVFGEDFDCRIYRIFNMNITNESKIYMKVSSDYNSLVFSNRGSDTLTYDVEFQNEMVDIDHYVPDQIPRLLITNLQIDPGQTQTITPENWRNLKNSEVIINAETCGDLICGIGEDHVNCPHDCEEIACVEPHDDMHITESTLLCSGTYPIDDWGDGGVIVIDNDDVVLDCNGAKLDGNGHGIAIISDSTKNVTVKNCYIQNFSTAVMFNNVTNAKIFHSAFVSNADSGIELIGNNQSQITQNYIKDNGYGIQIYSSTDTEISQNLVCPNVNIDIYSHTNNVNDTGFDNACDNAQGWDDINTTGCTYKCTYPVCVTPTDDLYINSDTTLCPGFYNIPDSGAEGVIIINASDIVLDCNGATINGTMTGSVYGIYSRGFDNVTIKNCNVMNYHAGIEL
jgi:parallel beta-helix repeat protein